MENKVKCIKTNCFLNIGGECKINDKECAAEYIKYIKKIDKYKRNNDITCVNINCFFNINKICSINDKDCRGYIKKDNSKSKIDNNYNENNDDEDNDWYDNC